MARRIGRYTIGLDQNAAVKGYASVVGKKEGEGPLAKEFDYISEDTTFGEKTWEKSESRMQKDALTRALDKAGIPAKAVELICAGDLLNQCIGTSYGLREFDIPLLGLYGACSTMAESLVLASIFLESGAVSVAAALTSSHFCSAERQYRYPLEYGGQRTPTSQWTVTGAGAVILAKDGGGPVIREVTVGKICDLGIRDINNMGAAMAPAAAETIAAFFTDTGQQPEAFDLIATGDLGLVGHSLLRELLSRKGLTFDRRLTDCGLMIFDRERQDVHAGASGCGCSASVLCSYILNHMSSGELKNVLLVSTGALMSPTSMQQGESIPSIAHLVHFSAP